jgi:hypothetical protein
MRANAGKVSRLNAYEARYVTNVKMGKEKDILQGRNTIRVKGSRGQKNISMVNRDNMGGEYIHVVIANMRNTGNVQGPRKIREEVRRSSEHILGEIFAEVTPGPNESSAQPDLCLVWVRTFIPLVGHRAKIYPYYR